jgi:hypothetical protein
VELLLESQGVVVLNHRALGPPRHRLDPSVIDGAWEQGAQSVLVLSVDEAESDATTQLRLLEMPAERREKSAASFRRSDLVSRPAVALHRAADEESLPSASRAASAPEPRATKYELTRPASWRPSHGRGPDFRPVLRDIETGSFIPYSRAYSLLGREDLQRRYDRKTRMRVALASAGSFFFAIGMSATLVTNLPGAANDDLEARGIATPMTVATVSSLLVGSSMVAASCLIDPHPLSVDELSHLVSKRVSLSHSPSYGLRLHASTAGAGAGFRATF